MKTNDLFQYTHADETLNLRTNNTLYARHQTDYDYHGCVNVDEDPADYQRPLKGARIA